MPFDGAQLDDVTKLLIEGRERIEQGWCQGAMRERGAVCMIGALASRFYSSASFASAVQRLGSAIGIEDAVGNSTIPYWNDAPERTKDEALAAFDRAIANG